MNAGRYYQLPAYTTLGYKNLAGNLVNKDNNLRYISADHIIAGVQYQPEEDMIFTAEGFFKYYRHYPFFRAGLYQPGFKRG